MYYPKFKSPSLAKVIVNVPALEDWSVPKSKRNARGDVEAVPVLL
jgi:hypothetical protein